MKIKNFIKFSKKKKMKDLKIKILKFIFMNLENKKMDGYKFRKKNRIFF